MKLLGEVIIFALWGVLSLIVLPMIATLNLAGQIVFGLSWIGTLLAVLFIHDMRYPKPKKRD